MVFPVVRYRHESWTIKKAECQRSDAFKLWCCRRLLRIPWIARSIVNPKGNQPFIGSTDSEAAASIHWPDMKSWPTGKDPDAWKNWRLKEKGVAKDELVGWHHQLNGCVWALSLGDREQRSLACCSPWSCRVGYNLAIEQQNCNYLYVLMQPNLGLLALWAVKPVYWHCDVVKGSAGCIAGHQGRHPCS